MSSFRGDFSSCIRSMPGSIRTLISTDAFLLTTSREKRRQHGRSEIDEAPSSTKLHMGIAEPSRLTLTENGKRTGSTTRRTAAAVRRGRARRWGAGRWAESSRVQPPTRCSTSDWAPPPLDLSSPLSAPAKRTVLFEKSPQFSGPKIYNALPPELKEEENYKIFKIKLRDWLVTRPFYTGFKTLELRLIGPTLIAGGLLCCLLRILLCVCPSVRCPRFGKRRGGGKRRPPDHDYYRHRPYRSRTANDFLLAEQPLPPPAVATSRLHAGGGGGDKKRVSIVQTPGVAGDRRPIRSSSTWRGGGGLAGRGGPLADLAGCEEGDSVELLELRSCGGAGAGAELQSASSEDSFNAESLALVGCEPPRDERLARLKSTLTFQDDVDDYDLCPQGGATAAASTCPRIDEEREDEITSSHSASPQPAPPQPVPSTSFARRELVLSPAKLQHI
ncbi:hypothetical protein LSTR_LSTR008664 [Laodelphax striatellus]|uniref:Uncharacterized protein n=1 Tax=Laodelphax striatellus TaxID=195883 RepID=A0A482X484_LAOST|nr:hypothetical protein LSTR_LSTR008664 [Laodelphax striatellus]